MRGALLVVTLILTLVSAPDATTAPIRPQLYLQLSPPNTNVTSPVDQNVSVTIDGNVTARMMSFERITIQLWSAVDADWSSAVSPDSMIIADTLPHPFTCDVTVPMKTKSMTATLEVDATYSGAGGTYFATATITVTQEPLTNQTAHNQTTHNQTAQPPSQADTGKSMVALDNTSLLMITGAVLVILVGGSVTYITIKRRKTIRD